VNIFNKIINYFININIVFTVFVLSSSVYAETVPELSVGATINFNYQAYKDVNKNPDILIQPVFFYDSTWLYAEGDEAGVNLFKNENNELRANLYYDGNQFDPKDSSINGLEKRRWSVMGGMSYMHITPYGGLKLQVGSDILSRSKGTVITASYLAEIETGRWTWYPEFGINWNNKKYNQYYFGVTEQESHNSGIESYSPKSSINPYLSLNSSYFVNNHLNIIWGVDVNYLTNQMFNSPLVDKRFDVEPFIGALYRF
jgi:MipA family protein